MPEEILFPTTIVGSYTRPSWLLGAYKTYHPRDGSPATNIDQLEQLQREAKLLTIKEEEDAGLDIVSDGEQGRTSFFEYLTEQLTGFAMSKSKPFSDGTRFLGLRKPVDKVGFRDKEPTSLKEAEFLRAHTKRKTKIAIISPNFLLTYWEPSDYYRTRDSFLEDMITVSREEAKSLSGKVDYVQWDDPMISFFTEARYSSEEARELTRDAVSNMNRVLQSVSFPAGMSKALHICWGNYKATHQADGPLSKIYQELLDLKVDLLLIEMASARHEDDIQVFKDYPDAKMKVAAGVVDVKTPDVEPVRLIKKRVERMLAYVPKENLYLTTDCGFAPEWDSDRIPRSSCYQKLESMAIAAGELRREYA